VLWDFSVDGKRPAPADMISVYHNRDQGVLFASFNSCVYETHQDHYGFISLSQQKNMEELPGRAGASTDVVRIAVVHTMFTHIRNLSISRARMGIGLICRPFAMVVYLRDF
jgi:hypothetical protein